MSEWWRDAALYQIYVRSFADSDGDGVGDLQGIRSRLPYVRELGVDGIWLTPFYPSPGHDHGYDVSDYLDVDPQFGTLADFEALVAHAHALDLRVVVDIVPNHTSSEHPWFRNALADPAHPDRARYFFRPGVAGGPPTAWTSAFGGPAWTLDEASGEWYLHFFAPEQPDLDWHNELVQRDFEEILRFWLERGVDGFRVDVAHALFKDQELPPMVEPVPRPWGGDWLVALDQPELHDLYRRWRALAGEYPNERIFVAEIVLANQETIARYVRPDELQLAFNFSLLHAGWDVEGLRVAIDETLRALGAVGASATWVLENHDVVRLPTRCGGGEEGLRRARAAALLLLALPGTAFVYQGQELGLEEVDLPAGARQDPIFFRTRGVRVGRDGCRVPLPWSGGPPGFGFTGGEPWLPMPRAWESLTAERQHGEPGSMLELYRRALALRPRGGFAWREATPPGVLAFERGGVVCAVNMSAAAVELPAGELLLASDAGVHDVLPPDAAAWIRHERRAER